MTFEHESVYLGYKDLSTDESDHGRVYVTPDDKRYPSITTVLKILTEEHIQAWRNKVGEETANRISTQAAGRGTSVHSILERYVNNDPIHVDKILPHIYQSLLDLKPILDERLSKVYAQEAPLYSDHLGVAGRVDCVGVWDGKNSIIDYKTSRKPKRREWIQNYFIQCAAYAIMWEERTKMPITQLVVVISVDGNEPQVFIEHRDRWTEKLIETINEYKRRKLFGR